MYKDKDKQREANKERQRRYKAKQKALLNQGVTQQGVTADDDESLRQPSLLKQVVVKSSNGTSTDLEKCRCCGADLPPLEQPRQHTGACGPCCWSGRAKAERLAQTMP